MNNLMKTMMLMMAMVAVTVRGQNLVTVTGTAALTPEGGHWTAASLTANVVDASNTTCVATDITFSTATTAVAAVLTVTYASSFTAQTIYLIAPSPPHADMYDAANIPSVTWGPATGTPATCDRGTAFSATNNVGSWTCGTNPTGTKLTVSTIPGGKSGTVHKSISFCNVMIYSNDAAFAPTTPTTTTTVTTTTARAAVTTAKGAKFLRSDLTLMLLGMVAATLKLATGAFGH